MVITIIKTLEYNWHFDEKGEQFYRAEVGRGHKGMGVVEKIENIENVDKAYRIYLDSGIVFTVFNANLVEEELLKKKD